MMGHTWVPGATWIADTTFRSWVPASQCEILLYHYTIICSVSPQQFRLQYQGFQGWILLILKGLPFFLRFQSRVAENTKLNITAS